MWHEHRADTFSVVFRATEAMNEEKGGTPATFTIPAGHVAFASDSKEPYVHRVTATADTPFHVVDIELLSPMPVGVQIPPKRSDPPFQVALENTRGRVYRFLLNPGEVTESFTRPARSVLFAISGGRISEHSEGKAPKLWDFEPGHFRWFDTRERLILKNEGTTPVELVEIEIY